MFTIVCFQEHSSAEHRSFKIHYGDLTGAILDPIALFGSLQTTNILPQGTIIRFDMPLTKQIQELMDAIETSIQRDSENFYKFMEVLEEDSSLQDLCDVLRSTCGEWCHNTCNMIIIYYVYILFIMTACMVYRQLLLSFSMYCLYSSNQVTTPSNRPI